MIPPVISFRTTRVSHCNNSTGDVSHIKVVVVEVSLDVHSLFLFTNHVMHKISGAAFAQHTTLKTALQVETEEINALDAPMFRFWGPVLLVEEKSSYVDLSINVTSPLY